MNEKFTCTIETYEGCESLGTTSEINGCGKETDYVLFDGYEFGDRLLEEVMFEGRKDDGVWKVKPHSKHDDAYLDDLNKKKWLKEAKKFVSDLDIAICPNCKGDIAVNVGVK